MKDDVDKVEQLRQEVARMAQKKEDMQRHYETKLTEMAQDREAERSTIHAKALQEETKPEKLKDRHSDGLDKLRQEDGAKKDAATVRGGVERSGARETTDTAPSTATVRTTGDTCRGTHGRGWRQNREGSGCQPHQIKKEHQYPNMSS